jgi:tRNA(Ile2) C34 agmatinyltransferase TiaS
MKRPKMPSSCCGVESTVHGAYGWRCSQCGRVWYTSEAERVASTVTKPADRDTTNYTTNFKRSKK